MADRSRRTFLQTGLQAGAVAALTTSTPAQTAAPSSMVQVPFSGKTPRVGLIGTGGRGTSLLNNLLAADVQVAALCDIVPEKAQHASELVTKAGQPSPAVYTKGDHAFEKLLARDDVDATFIATPWNWHTAMALHAMKQGKHAFTEVPAALTIDDCWELVNTSDKHAGTASC